MAPQARPSRFRADKGKGRQHQPRPEGDRGEEDYARRRERGPAGIGRVLRPTILFRTHTGNAR
jgi:hypothetical protein